MPTFDEDGKLYFIDPDAAGGERRQKHEVLPMCNAVGE